MKEKPIPNGVAVTFIGTCAEGEHKGGVITDSDWSQDDQMYFYTIMAKGGQIIDTCFEAGHDFV